MKNVITYTAPNIRPLPTTITDEVIRDVTLPVKIETARRAIANCTDLGELLKYRDHAQGLAAAVRIMKHVAPEMVRDANEMVADAWRKGGELLSQYSSIPRGMPKGYMPGAGVKRNGTMLSDRGKVAKELGLAERDVTAMVRIAKAPKAAIYEGVQKSISLARMAQTVPTVDTRGTGPKVTRTTQLRVLMNYLCCALGSLNKASEVDIRSLDRDERTVAKAKITQIIDLLDEMDRLCR